MYDTYEAVFAQPTTIKSNNKFEQNLEAVAKNLNQ